MWALDPPALGDGLDDNLHRVLGHSVEAMNLHSLFTVHRALDVLCQPQTVMLLQHFSQQVCKSLHACFAESFTAEVNIPFAISIAD